MALLFSSVIADIIFVVAVFFGLSYLFFSSSYKYWKRRGIHYIKPTLFIGNLGNVFLQKEGPLGLIKRTYEEATGHKTVGIFIFHKPILVVRDPEVLRSIMAKDAHNFLDRYFLPSEKIDRLFAKSLFAKKGNEWKHLRIKLTPTFTSGKMKKMFQLIDECGKQLMLSIDQVDSKGTSVVVKDFMARFTMDVIASCAFGVKANALQDPNSEFTSTMVKFFEQKGSQVFFGTLIFFMPWLENFVSEKFFDKGVNGFVRKTFWGVVDYRKMKGVARKDFVELLMQLREHGEVRADDAKDLEEIKQDSKYVNAENSNPEKYNITLDDDDIAAQALLFLIAGFETSSSVITFTLYELAMNPHIQDKLRREINQVLDKHGSQITYDAILEMTYLDMVASESMRKYPPLQVLDRVCQSDCTIEGTDINIDKGTVIFIPVHAIQNDPEYFPDPQRFDPERFSAGNKGKHLPFAYIPFGEGPRKCIGMRFGLLQVKTGLVHILRTFQVRTCKDTPPSPLELKKYSGTMSPEKDIVLTFTKLK